MAEALCRLGEAGPGLPMLDGLVRHHESPPVRPHAVNALDNLGDLVPLRARDVFDHAARDPDEYVRRAAHYTRRASPSSGLS